MIMKLSLIGVMFSVISFSVFQLHCLSLLISLEALMLSLLLFLFSLMSAVGSLFWFLVLLTFAACEAALGLSLLVSMLRIRGGDTSMFLSTTTFFAFTA